MINKDAGLKNVKLIDFPEEIDEQNGIKFYGETNWENQLAVLSHFLHNSKNISNENKAEIICAIRAFIERNEGDKNAITNEDIQIVAENPIEYYLFKLRNLNHLFL